MNSSRNEMRPHAIKKHIAVPAPAALRGIPENGSADQPPDQEDPIERLRRLAREQDQSDYGSPRYHTASMDSCPPAYSSVSSEVRDGVRHDIESLPRWEPSSSTTTDSGFTKIPYPMQEGIEETEEELLLRLGKERPKVFPTVYSEIAFCFAICMSQIISVRNAHLRILFSMLTSEQEYWVSGFTVILQTVSDELDIPNASRTWPASVFSLSIAASLLVMGRLADMFGGKVVYVAGMAWLTAWSLVAGFSQNELMLDFCRALQGFGPAAFLPAGLALIGKVYHIGGQRRNMVFCIYGACAPAGFFFGILAAGVAAQVKNVGGWSFYFWIGTAITFLTALVAFFFIPEEHTRDPDIKMDWLGAATISSGLILITFSIIGSSYAPQRWRTPYIFVLFIVGFLLLFVAAYIESNVASQPLLPPSLFKVKYMPALTVALFFTYGSLGIFLLYATYYMLNVLQITPFQVVAWYTPMFMGGIFISCFGGVVCHYHPYLIS
jgi:MFS family permease